MLASKFVKGWLGASAVAALFGTCAVQAQTPSTTAPSGQSTSGQGTTSGTGGQSGTSGQSGSSATGQGGAAVQGAAGQSSTQGSTASGTGAASKLSKADQRILTDLAMANMAEVETARMAQSKSQNEEIRKFAQQMIDDHGKALTEVQQLAQSKGVTLPAEVDRKHKAKADKLSAMSGEQFDRAYMAQAGVADHKQTHSMLRQAQGRAKDADIKALVAKLEPTVGQHLTTAQQLHGSKSTAKGSSTSGAEKAGQ